ncbi:Os06g0702000 [Oryza sativa Japonica Group]|uniref:Os06g0702000 protein n=2 Tax=Oryza sativa subsp. japonica TaxID=39947 RepID=A0A0P0X0L0_ORYSJ|nr:hypothetical protein EE612_036325 [Oryza sativa]BAD53781.1 unknown protein [Oryza sativa Japonica Group]BAH93710.1 Os06g0702000 [Oryza sativa Japonica Group]BAS99356.1 Os06g0702000 [Oryza sativa Japonica Group]|eukprot:NP_001174982.1 Os06g0702000 [Oryza sativa Japonica Group]
MMVMGYLLAPKKGGRRRDEFGFAQAGGLRVPCGEDDFEDLLRRLRRKNGGAAAAKAKKAIS